MNRYARSLGATLVVVFLGSLIVMLPPKNAAGAPPDKHDKDDKDVKDVVVVNTPLPVTGGVNVTNTVPTSQSGAWNVGVNNLPATQNVSFNGTAQPVSFPNTPTLPLYVRDVDNSTNPFQQRIALDNGFVNTGVFPGSSCSNITQCQANLNVPTGMRLVIEHISARVIGATGQKYLGNVTVASVGGMSIWFVFNFQGTFLNGTADNYTASQQMHVYTDDNAQPPAAAVLSSNLGQPFFADVEISGYLVPRP